MGQRVSIRPTVWTMSCSRGSTTAFAMLPKVSFCERLLAALAVSACISWVLAFPTYDGMGSFGSINHLVTGLTTLEAVGTGGIDPVNPSHHYMAIQSPRGELFRTRCYPFTSDMISHGTQVFPGTQLSIVPNHRRCFMCAATNCGTSTTSQQSTRCKYTIRQRPRLCRSKSLSVISKVHCLKEARRSGAELGGGRGLC